MEAKIERCVAPLSSSSSSLSSSLSSSSSHTHHHHHQFRKNLQREKHAFSLLTKVYALCALNADLDASNAIERVDVLLGVLLDCSNEEDEDGAFKKVDDGDGSSSFKRWTKATIEKQLKRKQSRLKEKREQFSEKEWVRFVCTREEDAKDVLEELFATLFANESDVDEEKKNKKKSDESASREGGSIDVRELFFHRYVVMFVMREKYDARARASLRRMVSVLNEYYEEYDDGANNNNEKKKKNGNDRRKKRVLVDWRKDVCKFEAAFAWHVIRGAREQMKRISEGDGNEEKTKTKTSSGGSWMMSKIRRGGESSATGSSASIISEDDAKNETTTTNNNAGGASSNSSSHLASKFGKYLTLGAAAVVGGSLLTLTGGLAAPALIASVGGLAASGSVFAVFGVGTAYVLGMLGTTGVTAIFGITGAGLAAHKMSKRIEQNLEIFRILPLRDGGLLLGKKTNSDEEDEEIKEDVPSDAVMNASLNIVLYVPGFLKSGPDELFDAFGSKNGNYYATIDGDGPLGLRMMKVKPKEDTDNFAKKKERLKKIAHLGNDYNNNNKNADIDADTLLIVEHDPNTLNDDNGVAKNAGILCGSAILSYHILETNERIVVDANNSSYRTHVETLKAIERAPRPVRLQLRKIQKLEIDREEIAEVALSITEDLEEMVENVEKEEKRRTEKEAECESPSSDTSENPKPPLKKENVEQDDASHLNLLMRTLTRTISFDAFKHNEKNSESFPTTTEKRSTITPLKSKAQEEEDNAMGTNTNWPIQSGEQFVLEWETTELTNLGSAINFFARKMLVNAAAPQAIGHTVFAGLAASVSWPAILLGGASFIDNPWSVLKERAQIAGKELATILLSKEHGRRAVTLIAYSTGTCVILECLKELDRMIEDGTCLEKDALGIVENVVLVSVPVHVGRKDWRKIRRVTSGRVVNCRAKNDWILRFIYRLKSYDVISSLAGVTRQNYEGVEDIKLDGNICYAHGDIPKAMGDILRVVGLETDENINAFVDASARKEDEGQQSFEQRREVSESDYDSETESEADFASHHQETIF